MMPALLPVLLLCVCLWISWAKNEPAPKGFRNRVVEPLHRRNPWLSICAARAPGLLRLRMATAWCSRGGRALVTSSRA